MFFYSCRCSYDHRLGVLGVAKITVSMHVHTVCVWGVLICTNVCVVFAYKYYTHTVFFSLSMKSPSGSRHQTLSSISHSTWRSSTPG